MNEWHKAPAEIDALMTDEQFNLLVDQWAEMAREQTKALERGQYRTADDLVSMFGYSDR